MDLIDDAADKRLVLRLVRCWSGCACSQTHLVGSDGINAPGRKDQPSNNDQERRKRDDTAGHDASPGDVTASSSGVSGVLSGPIHYHGSVLCAGYEEEHRCEPGPRKVTYSSHTAGTLSLPVQGPAQASSCHDLTGCESPGTRAAHGSHEQDPDQNATGALSPRARHSLRSPGSAEDAPAVPGFHPGGALH